MDNIIIDKSILELAQDLCGTISDSNNRNRAVANIVGAKIASNFFNSDVYKTDVDTALHNIAIINETYDISDIYINNAYIDVRVYFTKNELCVPKSHFETGILPKAYMFIKLANDLSYGTVTGFILPENIDKKNEINDCYYIDDSCLNSFYNIESHLVNSSDINKISNESIYDYIEGNLDDDKKIEFVKNLIASEEARVLFIKTVKAQAILNLISVNNISTEEETENSSSEISQDNLDELLSAMNNTIPDNAETDDTISENLDFATEITPSGSDVIQSLDTEDYEQSEQIDTLFNNEQQNSVKFSNKKKSGSFFVFLILLIIICGGGYWWYSNISNQKNVNDFQDYPETAPIAPDENPAKEALPQPSAMPNETVNKLPDTNTSDKEVGNAIEIPAIEKNLDASVLVSNLKVDWEVPAGYISNTSAKRYLVKLGKIIQLNLKSELLLLNRPPISNKVTVELTYNQNSNQFEVVGIKNSSGEKIVDDTIISVVKTALKMKLSSNIEPFGKLQGNPILIIHL